MINRYLRGQYRENEHAPLLESSGFTKIEELKQAAQEKLDNHFGVTNIPGITQLARVPEEIQRALKQNEYFVCLRDDKLVPDVNYGKICIEAFMLDSKRCSKFFGEQSPLQHEHRQRIRQGLVKEENINLLLELVQDKKEQLQQMFSALYASYPEQVDLEKNITEVIAILELAQIAKVNGANVDLVIKSITEAFGQLLDKDSAVKEFALKVRQAKITLKTSGIEVVSKQQPQDDKTIKEKLLEQLQLMSQDSSLATDSRMEIEKILLNARDQAQITENYSLQGMAADIKKILERIEQDPTIGKYSKIFNNIDRMLFPIFYGREDVNIKR